MSLLMLGALLLSPGQSPADAVIGRWKTETRNGIVQIDRCGTSICGRLISSELLRTRPDLRDLKNSNAALRSRPLRGLLVLSGFTFKGGSWDNGSIYNADDGRTYTARVTPVGPDQLKVRGCVFVPLCKTQTWTRVR